MFSRWRRPVSVCRGNKQWHILIASTGSGKTAAYMVPIISKLMGKAKKLAAPRPDTTAPGYNAMRHQVRAEPLVVIVVPTRELAMQIFDEARRMCYRSMLRPCVVYGGLPMPITRDQLGAGCDILIATPGRLCDLMDKPHILTMSRVKYTVIDEADEMLDSDWSEELEKIMGGGGMCPIVGRVCPIELEADLRQTRTMMPTTSTS